MAFKRNTRNPASPLFRKLTRIFSGPMVSYRRQTEINLRRRQTMKHKYKSASGLEFKKRDYDPFHNLRTEILYQHNRVTRYADFEQMEFDPILASSMDVYADEMTTSSDLKPMLKIRCSNREIEDELYQLYFNILNLEYNLFGWARSMCKYGDLFLYLDIDPDLGVKYAIGLPPTEIQRMEGEDPENPNYVQYQWNEAGLTLENWQVAHFRILGNDKFAPYGVSILDAARRIWRQTMLLEDAMMAYRIVRAPERKAFYIDVGNIAPQDVEQYMEQIITSLKRNQVVDNQTGKVDLRYDPLSIEEDYYIPVRGANNGTRIEPLPGGSYTGDVDDVKYLKDKLFAALKIPQAYLFRGEGADEDKTTLAQKDIMFARTVQRLQRSLITELMKVGMIHLYVKGYRDKDLVSFELYLNNPSRIAELQELEHWRTRFDVASAATENTFSRRWVSKNLLDMSDDEIKQNIREIYFDKKLEAEFTAIAEGGEGDDAGGGLGDMDLGGDEDLDLEGAADEIEDEEDETLLASPGKRSDEPYLTPGAKGKEYTPRPFDRRSMGARKRNMKAQYGAELGSNTTRNIFKGKSELSSLANGIMENEGKKKTNYTEEEKHQLLEHEVDQLLIELRSLSDTEKDGEVKDKIKKKRYIDQVKSSLGENRKKKPKLKSNRTTPAVAGDENDEKKS